MNVIISIELEARSCLLCFVKAQYKSLSTSYCWHSAHCLCKVFWGSSTKLDIEILKWMKNYFIQHYEIANSHQRIVAYMHNLIRYRLCMHTLQALGWTSFCTTWLPLQRNGISSPAKFCCCLSDRTFHILGNSSVQEWEARSELAWDSWHTAARKETVLVSWHRSKNLECRANSCCTVCCERNKGWNILSSWKPYR